MCNKGYNSFSCDLKVSGHESVYARHCALLQVKGVTLMGGGHFFGQEGRSGNGA